MVLWPHKAFLCPTKGVRPADRRFWDLFAAVSAAPRADVLRLAELAAAGGGAGGPGGPPVCVRGVGVGGGGRG